MPPPLPSWRPFPVAVLPAQLAHYVTIVARAIGVDPSFVALPVLVTLAGTIGNRFRVQLKKGWSEPAVLWGVVVGPSGSLKSPALTEVTAPVRDREAAIIERNEQSLRDHERAVEEWSERAKGSRGPKPEPPTPLARSLVSDVTVEALGERLKASPAGVLLYRDELAGWIKSFDQYRAGRGGDVQDWLQMYGAISLVVDRKTGGTALSVPRAAVSIIGSVQPAILQRCLCGEHTDNGLAARILFAMPPDRRKKWTDNEISNDVREDWARLLERLRTNYDAACGPIELSLTDDAHALWVDFYDRHADQEYDAGETMKAAYSKLEGAAARLALILQLVRNPDSRTVDSEAMAAGVELEGWFAHEAERLYGAFSETPADRERRELVEWIALRPGGSTTARDLAHGPRRYRDRGPGAAKKALQGLVSSGFGQWKEREPGPRGGRRTTVFCLTNPGTGTETCFGASGTETPEQGAGTGQTLAPKPDDSGGVLVPVPPGKDLESAPGPPIVAIENDPETREATTYTGDA